jgi:competence protein ComEC
MNGPSSSNNLKALSTNDASIVLRLEANGRSFLFPADISAAMAEFLAGNTKKLQADILLAPHHGSRSSLNRDFIARVDPEYIVVSAGRNSRFSGPAKSLYGLQRRNSKILTTGEDGTITFSVETDTMTVSRYRSSKSRDSFQTVVITQ